MKSKTRTFHFSSDGYDTEMNAFNDALNAFSDWLAQWDNDLEGGWDYEWVPNQIYAPCVRLEPPIEIPHQNPTPVVTQDEAGNYSVTLDFKTGWIYC
jgi:hypothetical protein